MSGDAGGNGPAPFLVAPGDPAQLTQAAAVHQDLADALELHEATVRGTAGALFREWDGEAANAYQTLSQDVSTSYLLAAGVARTSATALSQFSTILEHCQKAGAQALHEAQYWLQQQALWQSKLTAANTAVANAQSALTEGQSLGLSVLGILEVNQAKAALAKAEADQRVAHGKLTEAEHQAVLWEGRGRLAWDEAMVAAQRAVSVIGSLDITPPPLAGWAVKTPLPVKPPPPPPQHHSSSIWGDIENAFAWNALANNPIGDGMIIMHFASKWSGKTIGICAGGSGTFMPAGGTASVCYVATPDGGQGFTETVGGGGGVGDGASLFLGPMISNGKTLSDQGKWFSYVSAGGGDGWYGAGGSYAQGTNTQGKSIWVLSGGWEPGLSGGPPVSVQGGKSYTWTQELPPLP
jgi:hypothetical protein